MPVVPPAEDHTAAIMYKYRVGLDSHLRMPRRQQRRAHPVGRRTPSVQHSSCGKKETANAHGAHPSTRGRSVADPSDQGAVTRHIVHRKGTRNDQRVDRVATQRPHGFGDELHAVGGFQGAASDRNHRAFICSAAFARAAESRCHPERLQGAGQIEQRDAFVDGKNDAACFGRAHNDPGWQLSRDICH